jgi:hypothetical protein
MSREAPRLQLRPAKRASPVAQLATQEPVRVPPIRTYSTQTWTVEWLALSRLRRTGVGSGHQVVEQFEYAAAEATGVLHPDEPVARWTGPCDQTIFLPARVIHRIEQDKFDPDAIDRFSVDVLGDPLLGAIANGLPPDAGNFERDARLEIRCDQVIGNDTVVDRRCLIADGSIGQADADAIETFRPAVVELNLFGEVADMREFVADANRYLAHTPASFAVLGRSIVIRYDVPPPAARVVTLEVDWTEREGTTIGVIRRLYPGHARPELPGGLPFFRRYEGRHPLDAFATIKRRADERPPATPQERAAVESQRQAQEFWWGHAVLRTGHHA